MRGIVETYSIPRYFDLRYYLGIKGAGDMNKNALNKMIKKFKSMILLIRFPFRRSNASVKQSIASNLAPAPIGTYSQAIQFGQTLYISGQIPLDPETGFLVSSNIHDQIRQVFNNISSIAEASGGNINDCLKLTIYLKDLTDFEAVNTIMKEFFYQPYPARAILEISNLPKQSPIEIEAILGFTK